MEDSGKGGRAPEQKSAGAKELRSIQTSRRRGTGEWEQIEGKRGNKTKITNNNKQLRTKDQEKATYSIHIQKSEIASNRR